MFFFFTSFDNHLLAKNDDFFSDIYVGRNTKHKCHVFFSFLLKKPVCNFLVCINTFTPRDNKKRHRKK